jgi:hypothetical protein
MNFERNNNIIRIDRNIYKKILFAKSMRIELCEE